MARQLRGLAITAEGEEKRREYTTKARIFEAEAKRLHEAEISSALSKQHQREMRTKLAQAKKRSASKAQRALIDQQKQTRRKRGVDSHGKQRDWEDQIRAVISQYPDLSADKQRAHLPFACSARTILRYRKK